MANVKITDLTAYTNPAATDVLPIVDVGADVTKKVSIQDLLKNAGSGTAAAPGIAFDGDSDTGIYRPGANQVAISTGASEVARLDASGRLLVGTSSPITTSVGGVSYTAIREQLAGTDGNTSTKLLAQYSGSATFAPTLAFAKSKNSTLLGHTAVTSGVSIGRITAAGSNGTAFIEGARVEAIADANFATTSAPTRLVFSVTADGSASPTEAMRIKNSRILNFANTPVYADNAAAKTGGLVDGDVYRKSDGTLMIVYT